MKRVYLSGPMTGLPDNNFPAFHAWAARLREQGFDVVSPAEIQEAGIWEMCLRADIRELCTCDAIALMPGWEPSKGANLELHLAHRLGMEVMHLPLRFDLLAHLRRQIDFSSKTFGPGARIKGVCDHIRKELVEVEQSGGSLAEWIDVVILALDGTWRSGATPEQIVEALVAKQTRNEGRTWPDWRTADPNKAIEHDRSGEQTVIELDAATIGEGAATSGTRLRLDLHIEADRRTQICSALHDVAEHALDEGMSTGEFVIHHDAGALIEGTFAEPATSTTGAPL